MGQFSKYGRIAFVASGGAAKALFYHLGVSLALKEYGLEFPSGPVSEREKDLNYVDHVVGTSGGAIFGAMILNAFSEENILRKLEEKPLYSYFININKRKKGDLTGFTYNDIFAPPPFSLKDAAENLHRLFDLPNLMRRYGAGAGVESVLRELIRARGFFTLAGLEKYFRQVFPINDFNELHKKHGVELTITATELDSPRTAFFGPRRTERRTGGGAFYEDYYTDGVPISLAMQASSSVPGLFVPTRINDIDYVDGGVKKCLSTNAAVEQGADLIIVSHVITPYILDPRHGRLSDNGLLSIIIQSFNTIMYHKVRTTKETRERNESLLKYMNSRAFRKKYNLTAPQSREMIAEVFDIIHYKTGVRYIYIPSSSDIFFLDHFNLIPYATRELIHLGYSICHEVMEMQGFNRLAQYKDEGILARKGLHTFICDDSCRHHHEDLHGTIKDA